MIKVLLVDDNACGNQLTFVKRSEAPKVVPENQGNHARPPA